MAILDTTVVNLAIPTLGRVFTAEIASLQWVISGYMLAMAAVVPLSGWLSDRYSPRRIYLLALVLFAVGSTLCAFAPSAPLLIVFRVLQGFAGGLLMPTGMAMVFGMAPPHKRGTVMSVFGIPMLLGPALGPVLSGWLLQYADWRLIFLINVPVAVIAVLAGLRALPRPAERHAAGPLDLAGVILAPLAFASLSYGISESTTAGWTGLPTILGLGVGAIAFVLFVAREFSTEHPLLELRVFRSGDFLRGTLVLWAAFAGMFGSMFLLPLFLQQARGYNPLETGVYMLPGAIASAIVMQFGGRLFDRVGIRTPVMVGLVLAALAMWLFSRISAATTGLDLALPMVLQRSGMGLLATPLQAYLLGAAPRELVSRVTSLNSAFQSLVGSLAIAIYATILHARMVAAGASAGPAVSPGDLATAFGGVYQIAMVSIVVALALAFTLRRHAVTGGGVRRGETAGPSTVDASPAAGS